MVYGLLLCSLRLEATVMVSVAVIIAPVTRASSLNANHWTMGNPCQLGDATNETLVCSTGYCFITYSWSSWSWSQPSFRSLQGRHQVTRPRPRLLASGKPRPGNLFRPRCVNEVIGNKCDLSWPSGHQRGFNLASSCTNHSRGSIPKVNSWMHGNTHDYPEPLFPIKSGWIFFFTPSEL